MSTFYEQDSAGSKCNIIDKILVEMKSEFNKTDRTEKNQEEVNDNVNFIKNNGKTQSQLEMNNETQTGPPGTESSTKDSTKTTAKGSPKDDNADEKPRIVLTLRPDKTKCLKKTDGENADDFQESDDKTVVRVLRSKTGEPELKRSARRRSKDCNESVLQSAIARKEKSYNETIRPQRLSRRLKPTPKILANLEMCQKNAILKNEKLKQAERKVAKSPPAERKSFDKSEKRGAESDESEEKQEKWSKKRKHSSDKFKSPPMKAKHKTEDSLDKDTDTDDASSSSRQEDDERVVFNERIKKSPRKSTESDTKPSRRSHRKSAQSLDGEVKLEEDEEPLLGSLAEQGCFTAADPESTTVENGFVEGYVCLCGKSSNVFLATSESTGISITIHILT